ncbi:hypothetical protein WB334_26365, partial [Escherichia coli]|uniref:hypothetical protein n=1 Tax=Escherichia coli TaxID=562 RepID=UPI00215764DF
AGPRSAPPSTRAGGPTTVSPENAFNPYLVGPDSFEVDLGPPRDEAHFAHGHQDELLELHSDEEVPVEDVVLDIFVDVDAIDDDAVGDLSFDVVLDALDRSGDAIVRGGRR